MPENKAIENIIKRVVLESSSLVSTRSLRKALISLWAWGVDKISDEDLRKSLSNFYEVRVPFQFFVSPSSSTGHHHPFWHNEPGGIVRHLVESCAISEALLNSFGFNALKRNGNIKEYNNMKDIVLAASLISDTFKNGNPWGKFTNRDHGRIAAEIWERVAIGCDVRKDLIDKVYEASAWHYGRFTPSDNPKELEELPTHIKIVHLADSISSSQFIAYIYTSLPTIILPLKEKENAKLA